MGLTSLLMSVERRAMPLLLLLLDHGAYTEIWNAKGFCAVHIAAGKGWAQGTDALIRAGADRNARTEEGEVKLGRLVCWQRELAPGGARLGTPPSSLCPLSCWSFADSRHGCCQAWEMGDRQCVGSPRREPALGQAQDTPHAAGHCR